MIRRPNEPPALFLVSVKLSAHRQAKFHVVAVNYLDAIDRVMKSRPTLVRKQCEVEEIVGGIAAI